MSIRLHEIEAADFLRLDPLIFGGPNVRDVVRSLTQRLHRGGCRGAWLVATSDRTVGAITFNRLPAAGEAEIGYGIAEPFRRRGYATAAVAAVLERAAHYGAWRALTALTSCANVASARVLERNGFVRVGVGMDPEEGAMDAWRCELPTRPAVSNRRSIRAVERGV